MSPSDSVRMCSRRNNICYVIEEERPDNMGVENKSSEKQNEADVKDSMDFSLEIRHSSYEFDNERKNIARHRNDTMSTNVFSELEKVYNSAEENEVYGARASSFCQSRKLSMFHRKPSNVSTANTHSSASTLCETSVSDQQQHSTPGRNNLEVKSGILILIVSEQVNRANTCNLNNSRHATTRTLFPSRYPVIVKVHRRSYEKYAVISRTRRHSTMPSFFLKLKQSHVTQSLSNPSHFTVTDGGPSGKSFTFEASSPEEAKVWIQAFSSDSSQSRISLPHYKQSHKTREQLFPGMNSHEMVQSLISAPQLKLPNSPLLPALSELLVENDEE